MAKKTILLTEDQLRAVIMDSLIEAIAYNKTPIMEGIDIKEEGDTKLVSLNFSHQNGVDTNDLIHPYYFENKFMNNKYVIISIFQRKDNDNNTLDGNPLLYALKGINGWKFSSPQDEQKFFERFVAVTGQLQEKYDTLIMTPSSNSFNNKVFGYLKDLVDHEYYFTKLFNKLSAEEVYKSIKWEDVLRYAKGNQVRANKISESLKKDFDAMCKMNGGVFSYKYIKETGLRNIIQCSMRLADDVADGSKYAEAINDKKVLVFDDTVTTGKTLSDSAMLIQQFFAPRSITFLTVFSPKTSNTSNRKKRKDRGNEEEFENNKIYL